MRTEPTPEYPVSPETLVSDYHGASLANPFIYPGERPSTSFVTDGELVQAMTVTSQAGQLVMTVEGEAGPESIDDYLKQHQAEPLAQRIPVLAYGANMSPASLATKFAKPGRADALVVPTIYTTLPGYDVVWSGAIGMNGHFIAALYSGPETASTEVQVGINFLTVEQTLMLHATELNYDLYPMTVQVAGQPMPVYYYGGKDSYYWANDHPVAVEAVPATQRQLPSADAYFMSQQALREPAVSAGLHDTYPVAFPDEEITPEAYVEFVRNLIKPKGTKATPRLDFKRYMAALLDEAGKAQAGNLAATAVPASWANPATLRRYGQTDQADPLVYRLPEQELPIANWADPAKRQLVLHNIGEHLARYFPSK